MNDANDSQSNPHPFGRKRKSSKMLNVPMEPEYMPPPLSPRRPSGPSSDNKASKAAAVSDKLKIDVSDQSTSWLDTIDESGGSSGSSVHSRSSSLRLRRKRIRSRSLEDDTEAAFGAALDAAVEAAYDDGFEVADDTDAFRKSDVYSQAKRNVELARERVRQVELETAAAQKAKADAKKNLGDGVKAGDVDYLDEEAEEEERLLEEMTKGYVMDDFEFDLQSMSALPRQSDSSGFSGKTWPSSTGSNNATTGTSLTTLPESAEPTTTVPPPLPPPAGALPVPPKPNPKAAASTTLLASRPPSFGAPSGPGVRDRRLSGQKAKELKIQTDAKSISQLPSQRPEPAIGSATSKPAPLPKDDPKSVTALASRPRPNIARAVTSQLTTPIEPMASQELPRPSATPKLTQAPAKSIGEPLVSGSPGRAITKVSSAPEGLRKNASSTSLKSRNLMVATPELPDTSPGTPVSGTWPQTVDSKRVFGAPAPAMPTPTAANFIVNGLPTGGMHLFEDHIRSSEDPSTPNQATMVAPAPLEPCPESFLLRPFWLMRCLYQTLAHPRGGYVTSKLFVPRDVWRVKNVKLKGIDEKVSSCDLLTAALLKLGKVDTLDADAVLEEMQSLEGVLDQVRASLTKKLGGEVGVHGASSLFKASAGTTDDSGNAEPLSSKSSNASSGKSYLAGGWRKLRSKSSGAGFTNTVNTAAVREGGKDTLSMSSLPMTPTPTSKPPKRSVSQIQCAGPHANYMGALAKLFDAVQVLGKKSLFSLEVRID